MELRRLMQKNWTAPVDHPEIFMQDIIIVQLYNLSQGNFQS